MFYNKQKNRYGDLGCERHRIKKLSMAVAQNGFAQPVHTTPRPALKLPKLSHH
jgi:predicted dienelactone hydrolase